MRKVSLSYTFFFFGLLAWAMLQSTVAIAQSYGNEWINFTQQYYKIPVAEQGIFRISFDEAVAAGIPVTAVDPRKFQIYHRGNELAIRVAGQANARFEPGDYIEFYAEGNDGVLDQAMYIAPEAQPHQYYNLYTDTTAYFLTWNIGPTNGRRMSSFNESNINNLASESYGWRKQQLVLTDTYSKGSIYPEGTDGQSELSVFDYGEGWSGPRIRQGNSATYEMNGLQDAVRTGPAPEITVVLAGRSNRPHNATVLVGPSAGALRKLDDAVFDFMKNYTISGSLNWSDISADGKLFIRLQVNGVAGSNNDFVSVSLVDLNMPASFNLSGGNKTLRVQNAESRAFIQLQNVPANFNLFDISNKYNPIAIGSQQSGSNASAMVARTTGGNNLYASGGFKSCEIIPVNFRRITPVSGNFLMISHRAIMNSGNGSNPVRDYAAYRASAQGGAFDTLSVSVDQLYNQFNYGETSALGIRNFARYMIENGDPAYFLLLGKGLDVSMDYYRKGNDRGLHDYVPPFGAPGADVPYVSNLKGSGLAQAVPIGRVNVRDGNELTAYLNKLKEMESQPYDALWRKRLVHLSGGVSVGELILFKSFVQDFKLVAENHFLGGDVTISSKSTNNSVELINISEEVNDGLGMITFFGHSSAFVTDIEIGRVSNDIHNYNNKGKYPLILINGCNAGFIFGNGYSFGEDWIATPNRGAIGFLSLSAYGYVGPLKRFSDFFYAKAFADSAFINRSIGDIHLEVAKLYQERAPETEIHRAQIEQMVLQGDPAYRVFGAEKPDYAVDESSFSVQSFDGGPVTALSDSFSINIIAKNFGRTSTRPLSVGVTRTFSDGRRVEYDTVNFESVKFQDTLRYTIRSRDPNSFGLNRFEVTLDDGNYIEELNETNNTASFSYFIPISGVTNLYPLNFAVTDQRTINFKAQATDILSEQRTFVLEVDTSPNFNSINRKVYNTNAEVLASWNVALPGSASDTTTFYWRTKFASQGNDEDTTWSRSSFTYIPNSTKGWMQRTFAQKASSRFQGIVPNTADEKFAFQERTTDLMVRTYGANHPELTNQDVEIFIEGVPYIFTEWLCGNNLMAAVAFDKTSTNPYNVLNVGSCGRWPQVINSFTKNNIENNNRLTAYIEQVKIGDKVVLFSLGNVTYESWPQSLKDKLMEIGLNADDMEKVSNGEPLIIFGQKGAAPGSATMITADAGRAEALNEQEIILETKVSGRLSEGTVVSPSIGPASRWGALNINLSNYSQEELLNTFVQVYGQSLDGEETLLLDQQRNQAVDLSGISAQQYPYLKLRLYSKNVQELVPAQLRFWHITYDPVPEGILLFAGDKNAVKEPMMVQEGATLMVPFIFLNISDMAFQDSLTVEHNIFNQPRREATSSAMRIAAPLPEDTTHFELNFATRNKAGMNNLNVFVNPRLQAEQHYNNNITELTNYVDVQRDKKNPIIDVAFDGRYIMDGDIVSPSAVINVRVKDENPFLLIQDTTQTQIFMKKPCEGCGFNRIYYSDPNISWTPATDEGKSFEVEFKPERLTDGIYSLRVQAADASGNQAGTKPFIINFEVVNESKVTHFYPYPNPFSTKTQFVFTLTGAEIPDEIKIQIMTVTGKIVREITQDELGPIQIGHNISYYAWDGRDEFGDQLANGVYLYRVIVRIDGLQMDRRSTSADQAFKKEFGKIYLLR